MTITASATDARVARLRSLLDERELDGMLISRIANKRYFSGLRLMAEEESTWPGTLLVTRDAKLLLADSRYTEQAEHEAPGLGGDPHDRRDRPGPAADPRAPRGRRARHGGGGR